MKIKSEKRLSIFLFLIILAGLTFNHFYNVKAQNATIWATIKISVCGNNVKEEGEQCDRTDLGGATCQSLGYSGGTLRCTSGCLFDTSGCYSGGGGGGGGVYVPPPAETRVIIQGMAYPMANVTVLKDGVVAGSTIADPGASFKIELTNLTAGVWTFSLWAEDNKGRRSQTFSFTVTITAGVTTTISNIFLPPTIDLTTDRVKKGETLGILGQTAPQSEIIIYVYSPTEPLIKKTKADLVGAYFYNLDTTPLEIGQHSVKSKAQAPNGLITDFSKTLSFQVLEELPTKPPPTEKCHKANLNCDFDKKDRNTINFVDVSILLYNWGKPKNPRADLNGDGKVNYTDLSILLYYWTG